MYVQKDTIYEKLQLINNRAFVKVGQVVFYYLRPIDVVPNKEMDNPGYKKCCGPNINSDHFLIR